MNDTSGRNIRGRAWVGATAGITMALALAPVARAAEAEPQSSNRPNVVYAFSDQHRWHSTSFSDMPQVKTPNLQRLADQGFTFTHCISNYPVCSPHRAILMTGRWPHQQGVIDNNIALSRDEMTLGKAFKAAGYATGYVGKWHLGGARAEPFGFDHSLIWSGTNNHWESFYHPPGGARVAAKGYNASLMTDQALEFIENNKQRRFFLMLSWNPPHADFTDAPETYKALYPDEKSLPRRPNVTPPETSRQRRASAWPVYRGYHAHVSAIDAELGRIMKKLDELDLAPNTILVYSSDHGSMLGSHGLGGKRLPYGESIRVPFIVRWPKVLAAGTRSDVLFGTIDVMPSVCGLAGIGIPKSCVGQDFSPTMRGRKGPEPKSQFIMHISKKHASGGVRNPAPLFRGVTTGRYTYAVYPDRPWCLFDNRQDPYQMHNLIDDPSKATICKELRAMLAEWLTRAEDPFVMPE